MLITLFSIEKSNAEISDSIFMTIGNKPITKSDIVNEIKIILILNNQSYSDEIRDTLHDLAVKSTIKRTVKEIELERHNYYHFNKEDLEKELSRLAGNLYIDVETLKNICESNNLDFSKVEHQMKVELYWNSLIFEMYKNRLAINPEQIEEQLKLLQNKKKIEEYLISEIVIKPVEAGQIETKIQKLKERIEIEGFEVVAKEISISESAFKGGDIGWVNENVVSNDVRNALKNTSVGKISTPIVMPQGILIFKLRDKKEIEKNISLEEMKNQLVSSEKTKILNMHALSHYDKVRRSISIKYFQ